MLPYADTDVVFLSELLTPNAQKACEESRLEKYIKDTIGITPCDVSCGFFEDYLLHDFCGNKYTINTTSVRRELEKLHAVAWDDAAFLASKRVQPNGDYGSTLYLRDETTLLRSLLTKEAQEAAKRWKLGEYVDAVELRWFHNMSTLRTSEKSVSRGLTPVRDIHLNVDAYITSYNNIIDIKKEKIYRRLAEIAVDFYETKTITGSSSIGERFR